MTDEIVDRKPKAVTGCVFLLLYPVQVWWWGFVAVKLWGWFLVQYVPAVPGVWHIAGLGLALKYIASHMPNTDRSKWRSQSFDAYFIDCLFGYVHPAMVLLMGWLIMRFGMS